MSGLIKRSWRGLAGFSQACVTAVPGSGFRYARAWAVWGRELHKFALVDPDRSFLYACVPKAANTTIRRLLWRHLGVQVSGPMVQRTLHVSSGPYLSLPQLAFGERSRILTDARVFRFTFVRNPYDRLRSAYLQKLLHPAPHETTNHYLRALRWGGTEPPSFEEFVRRVAAQSDAQMNIHWKPQSLCLVADAIAYDFIGKVERFDEDIQVVLARIGADPGLYEPAINTNRLGGDRQTARFTEELAELAFKRFRVDFERFGYSRDSFQPDRADA